MSVYKCVCVYICIYTYTNLYTYIYIYAYIYTNIYMYICIHIYIYIYTYIYILTYIYIYMKYTYITIPYPKTSVCRSCISFAYEEALVSRIDKITGLFCKRAL